MELLYGLITILFFVSVILLLIILFKNDQGTNKGSDKDSISVKNLLGGFIGKKPAVDPNADYRLSYGSPDSVNETLYDTALYVDITNVRDENVHVRGEIMKDNNLSKDGVSIGRDSYCDYRIETLYIDSFGSFLLKLTGDTFHIYAHEDSHNGLKTDYKGEKVTHVAFKEHQTVYVGPVCFNFYVPDYKGATTPVSNKGGRGRFFTDEDEVRRPDKTRTYNG